MFLATNGVPALARAWLPIAATTADPFANPWPNGASAQHSLEKRIPSWHRGRYKPQVHPELSGNRRVVERFFAWLNDFRRRSKRFDHCMRPSFSWPAPEFVSDDFCNKFQDSLTSRKKYILLKKIAKALVKTATHSIGIVVTQMPLEFQIKTFDPAHAQITQFLREQILEDKWPPGSRLPPIQKMAGQFGTNYRTVHIALTPLVKEGLIVRVHGSGTFVQERSSQLTCTGIYHFHEVWKNPHGGYFQALSDCLQKAFASRRISTSIWIDSRPEKNQTTALPNLAQAIERKEIQSLVVGMVAPVTVPSLERLPIPTCFTGGATTLRNRVHLDNRQMIHSSLAELRRLGCKTVGLVCNTHTVHDERDRASDQRQLQFFEAFLDAVAANNLETRNSWMVAPHTWLPISEQLGYDQFRSLWNQPERPDGVLVYPDVLARGAIALCIELGINIPRDLKLVLHRNAEVEFLCPLPVSWIETSARQVAETAVDQILKQFNNRKVQPVVIPYRLYSLDGYGTTCRIDC